MELRERGAVHAVFAGLRRHREHEICALADKNWFCSVSLDGRESPQITYDPFSTQWIYVLIRASYGVLRSSEGWRGNQIVFSGQMTMVGINCDWRMTWTRQSSDQFFFVNE